MLEVLEGRGVPESPSQTVLKIVSDNGHVYSFIVSPVLKSSLASLGCSPLSPPVEVPVKQTHICDNNITQMCFDY